MSESTEPDFNLDLHFLPSWAQKPSDANRYSNYSGETERGDRRSRRSQDRPGGPRPPRARRDPRAGSGGGDSRDREARQNRGARRGPGAPGQRRPARDQQSFQPAPLPELNVTIVPDDHGVDSLTKQIRMTGRAYPLFEIARMVLQKPERHSYTVAVKKNDEGQPKQPLYSCAIDESVWLSEDAAVRYILDKHFDLFYQAERTPVEPPKGTYTFVAQCGMSGVILGPPNYHDYQKNLRELHAKRFSRMNFEAFKSRVKIVKDEEIVKKWLEEKSFTTEYNCLNLPEPLKLNSREDVEKHFRETHLPNVLRQVDSVSIKGTGLRDIRVPDMARLLRKTLDDQRRFPLQVVTVLSQQFASRGLQFFKVNKTVTHVSVARPHYLDLDVTPVSDNIKRIVRFIDEHKGTTRKELIDTLAPPAPKTEAAPEQEPESKTMSDTEVKPESPAAADAPAAPASSQAKPSSPPAPPAPPAPPSPEATAVITDLHWLVHEGHVIEFATGTLETAKKPVAKPPKPEKKKTKETAAPVASSGAIQVSDSTPVPASTPTEPSAAGGADQAATADVSSMSGGSSSGPGIASPAPAPAPGSEPPEPESSAPLETDTSVPVKQTPAEDTRVTEEKKTESSPPSGDNPA